MASTHTKYTPPPPRNMGSVPDTAIPRPPNGAEDHVKKAGEGSWNSWPACTAQEDGAGGGSTLRRELPRHTHVQWRNYEVKCFISQEGEGEAGREGEGEGVGPRWPKLASTAPLTCCGSMYIKGDPPKGERVTENPAAPSGTITWKYWDQMPLVGSPVRTRVTVARTTHRHNNHTSAALPCCFHINHAISCHLSSHGQPQENKVASARSQRAPPATAIYVATFT